MNNDRDNHNDGDQYDDQDDNYNDNKINDYNDNFDLDEANLDQMVQANLFHLWTQQSELSAKSFPPSGSNSNTKCWKRSINPNQSRKSKPANDSFKPHPLHHLSFYNILD